MPALRKVGGMASLLLEQYMKQKAAERDAALMEARQKSLADYEHGLALKREGVQQSNQVKLREIDAGNKEKDRFAADPDFASRSAQSGNVAAQPFIRRNSEVLAPGMDAIGKAKNVEDLPSMNALFGMRKGGIIDNLNPLTEMFNARNAQAQTINNADEMEVDQAGATKFAEGMAEEDVAAQTHGAVLGRRGDTSKQDNDFRLRLERGLTPIMVDRAGQSSGASARAQQTVENSPIAAEVVATPERLDSLSPTMRAQVIAHIRSAGGELGRARDESVNRTLLDAHAAIQNLKEHDGMAGAVGAKGLSSFFGMKAEPMAGTGAASYVKYIDQLKANLTLPRLQFLRGLGHMSDREFGSVASSVTALSRDMREVDFATELQNIEKGVTEALVKAGIMPPQPEENAVLESATQKLQRLRGGAR
jgi:hypothetical protein